MSWKKRLGALVADFGEDIARRLAATLPETATPREARAAATRMAAAPAKSPARPNLAVRPRVSERPASPRGASRDLERETRTFAAKPQSASVIRGRAGSPRATAQDVLEEAARPSKGALSYAEWRIKNPGAGELFDISNLASVPGVPQIQMQRVNPPKGPSPRITEALAMPEVERGITETVQRGIEGGGKEWYNTEPMRQRLMGVVPSADVDPTYSRLMDIIAATSPRARVPDNIRTGSYYNYLRAQGEPVPDKPAPGYGSIAQNLHRENVRGLEERGGWDIFKNPKPASFSTNLQGNQQNVTIDTHNFRLPGILARDPRFLETSIAELAKSPESALETLQRQYPNLPKDIAASAVSEKPGKVSINYKPQDWVNKGYITMEEAVNDPALWASKPRDNEYGYYESWQQDQAAKMGISPAQYQAAMWLGGGETTGLGSAAEPFVGTFEARVRYTAARLGMDPEKVLEMMLRGDIPLLAEGGAVGRENLTVKAGWRKGRGRARG